MAHVLCRWTSRTGKCVRLIPLCCVAIVAAFALAGGVAGAQDAPPEGEVVELETDRQLTVRRDWAFTVVPYVWMMGLSGDVSVNDREVSFDSSFSDLLDVTNFAFQAYAEAARPKWGLFADIIYADTGAEDDRRFVDVKVDSKLAFIEGAVFRRFRLGAPEREHPHMLDLFAGTRWNYTEMELDAKSLLFRINTDTSSSNDWFELMVGARAQLALSERWSLNLRTDFAGFGIGESSELTWTALAIFGYALNERTTAYMGYRHRDLSFDQDSGRDDLSLDLVISGPVIGFGFRF